MTLQTHTDHPDDSMLQPLSLKRSSASDPIENELYFAEQIRMQMQMTNRSASCLTYSRSVASYFD